MEKFTELKSIPSYLSLQNIDTDMIIPKQFLKTIKKEFGSDVANIVDGVTKLDRIQYNSNEEAKAEAIRKMVIAMSKDIRVLILKLADRLHNIQTIEYLADHKQERIASETLYVYAPLAHRLGLQNIKHIFRRCLFWTCYIKIKIWRLKV